MVKWRKKNHTCIFRAESVDDNICITWYKRALDTCLKTEKQVQHCYRCFPTPKTIFMVAYGWILYMVILYSHYFPLGEGGLYVREENHEESETVENCNFCHTTRCVVINEFETFIKKRDFFIHISVCVRVNRKKITVTLYIHIYYVMCIPT